MDLGRDAKQLGSFEIGGLIAAIRELPMDLWLADATRQQAFDAHHSTQTIKLIADGDFRHANPTIHDRFHEFEPHLRPLMDFIRAHHAQSFRQRALAATHGPGYFVRALLTRLPAGAEIGPHIDEGYSLKRAHRVHVPIITNDATEFRVGGSVLHMRAGEMWEINNRRVHAVRNDGTDARVHLILDYVQPGETIFDAEGVLTA